MVSCGEPEDLCREFLVRTRCLTACYAEAGGGDHHLHRGLTQIKSLEKAAPLVVGIGEDARDRCIGTGCPRCPRPHAGEAL